MVHYKLTYFNGRGRAELTRLIFAAAGVQYEDIRLDSEKWQALKPKTPFGQIPILEVDGVTLAQSYAIARFLARKFNLAGKTELEQAKVDMVIDCLEDTVKPLFAFLFEADEAKKNALKKKFIEEQIPASFVLLENLLKTNHNGDGYFVGSELTWADLGVINVADWLSIFKADGEFAKHPKLNALRQRVAKLHAKVAEWLAKRPATDF